MSKKQWIDESGLLIPASRVTRSEKLRERYADKLLKASLKVNEHLTHLKDQFAEMCEEVFLEVMKENEVDTTDIKGNFTWYNFDRSIKIEVAISERIDFDDALITAAKEKFDEFLTSATGSVEDMVRHLILDAFKNTKGRLDVKRVMSLVRYRSKVPKTRYPLFHEAVDLIEKSIRRPDSKRYFRIWIKDDEGGYQPVNLNFSAA